MSLAAALTPLVKAAHYKPKARWFLNVGSFTVAGAVSSSCVGLVLGAIGGALPVSLAGVTGIAVAITVASLAMARETGVRRIPLPQVRRATPGGWARTLSGPIVPALWGFDLGLFFTTFFTFAGAWLLVALAVFSGAPSFGAALFLAYWGGRALSIWLAPLFLPDGSATSQMMSAFVLQHRQFQLLHVVGLGLMTTVLIGMALTSTPLW